MRCPDTSEALPHWEAGHHVGPDNIVLVAVLVRRLDAVSREAVHGESYQCVVAALVLPILVDGGIDVADLLHAVGDGILVGSELA